MELRLWLAWGVSLTVPLQHGAPEGHWTTIGIRLIGHWTALHVCDSCRSQAIKAGRVQSWESSLMMITTFLMVTTYLMITAHLRKCIGMQTTLRIRGHDDDVNAVVFLDDSSNLVASGSDDTLIKASPPSDFSAPRITLLAREVLEQHFAFYPESPAYSSLPPCQGLQRGLNKHCGAFSYGIGGRCAAIGQLAC